MEEESRSICLLSPTSAASTQSEGTSSKSMPARRPPVAQPLSKRPKLGELTMLDTSLPAPWRKYRDILLVSWMAVRKTIETFGYTKHDSIAARYDWCVKDGLQKPLRAIGPASHACAKSYREHSCACCYSAWRVPWGFEHLIVESLAVQHCVNHQYDSTLDAIPSYAIMKGQSRWAH